MHTDIRRLLRDAVSTKRPEKSGANSSFLLHGNAPAHRSVLVKDFVTMNNLTTLEHPPYSSKPAAADFYLLPRIASALQERRFCDAYDIIKKATERMKRLSQNGF